MFQFADQRLPQEWNVLTCSAVGVQVISNPKDYISAGPMQTSLARVQLTVYGHGNDSQNADAVAQAIFAWLPTLSLAGIPNQAPNFVLNDRDGGLSQTQPLTYLRFIDVGIYSSDDG